ncbi:PRC and DUF2382 domain-containing protein [Kitasatospora sp. NPDC048365]|uniref:PRC and DUF2382 domain-containing protein n=1 Tax=Kitasatospora sp. NPDC048365 TaxID=3364050 RepID=UPI003716FEC3
MQTDIDPRDLIGHKAVDRNGDKIGTVDEVYLDDATGEPEWAAVRTGIFGRDAFVPLTTSEFSGDELRVPYDKSLIKESPDFGVGQHLSPAQELQLYRYYGLDTGNGQPVPPTAANGSLAAERPADKSMDKPVDRDFGTTAPVAAAAAAQAAGAQPAQHAQPAVNRTLAPPPTYAAPAEHKLPQTQPQPQAHARTAATGDAPAAPIEITCREERLEITTEWHELGTARLRKYVTTEPVERRVPVVRERVRVERVPVTEQERESLTEQEIDEAMEEVTLREERPVVRKYLAPIERVRLVVERYTEEEVIHEELRREQVEVHDSTAEPAAGPSGRSAGTRQHGAPQPNGVQQHAAQQLGIQQPTQAHPAPMGTVPLSHPAPLHNGHPETVAAATVRPEPLRPA